MDIPLLYDAHSFSKETFLSLLVDGLATGHTAEAAIEAIRREHPASTILAVPVALPSTLRRLSSLVDELVCVVTPTRLPFIGEWHDDFSPVSDDEVVAILNRSRRDAHAASPAFRTARASRSSLSSSK